MLNNRVEWLPALVLLEDYRGDAEKYIKVIYKIFRQEFIENPPNYKNQRVGITKQPFYDGKEAGFWHLIQEGKVEIDRLPDIRRFERIKWPRAIIINERDIRIKVWENKRGNKKFICLWIECADYLLVLAKRKGYVLLWTGYPITYPNRKNDLQKEYEEYTKANAAV